MFSVKCFQLKLRFCCWGKRTTNRLKLLELTLKRHNFPFVTSHGANAKHFYDIFKKIGGKIKEVNKRAEFSQSVQ